jgi:C-terminal processing protease CtpA/Prc
LQDLGLYEAVEKIKGPASSSVDLKILRAGESDILEIRVIRQKIVIPSVEAEAYEESKDYYISLNKF